MRFKLVKIIATLLVNTLHSCLSDNILSCVDTLDNSCTGSNEICSQASGKCECLGGYILVGKDCVAPSENTGHTVITVVVILVTCTLILVSLFLLARKYNLVEYIRNKINARRNNDVIYEDVMIGQDDPPLSF